MTTYDDAQAEVKRIDAQIGDWHATRSAKAQELATLKQRGPTQVLTGNKTAADLAQQQALLADEIEAIGGIVAELQAQRQSAEHAVEVARIADLRAQADALEAEAAPILAQRHALLSQLEALEGPAYMLDPRSGQLMHQAQRLRDAAIMAEVPLTDAPVDRDAAGNEIRRRNPDPMYPPARPVKNYEPTLK